MSNDHQYLTTEQLQSLPREELLKIIFDTRDRVIVVENSIQYIKEYIEKQEKYNSQITELNNNLSHLNDTISFYDNAKITVRTIKIIGNVIKWIASVVFAASIIFGISKIGGQ